MQPSQFDTHVCKYCIGETEACHRGQFSSVGFQSLSLQPTVAGGQPLTEKVMLEGLPLGQQSPPAAAHALMQQVGSQTREWALPQWMDR